METMADRRNFHISCASDVPITTCLNGFSENRVAMVGTFLGGWGEGRGVAANSRARGNLARRK